MRPKIKILGIGSEGIDTINYMIKSGVNYVNYIAIDTDARNLESSLADKKIQIKRDKSKGLDEKVILSEEESTKVKSLLEEINMVFIVIGMEENTELDLSLSIIKVAKELRLLRVVVAIEPFSAEEKRNKSIESIIEEIKKNTNSLMVIPNNNLLEKTLNLDEKYKKTNEILKLAIKGIIDSIYNHGLLSLELFDIDSFLFRAGTLGLGFTIANEEDTGEEMLEKILASPLLKRGISGSNGMIINVVGTSNLSATKILLLNFLLSEKNANNCIVMPALGTDESLKDKVEITLIVSYLTEKVKLEDLNLDPNSMLGKVKKYKENPEEFGEELFLPMFIKRYRED